MTAVFPRPALAQTSPGHPCRDAPVGRLYTTFPQILHYLFIVLQYAVVAWAGSGPDSDTVPYPQQQIWYVGMK